MKALRRTNTVVLAPSTKQHYKLLQLADECARLWNELTYRRRQTFFKGYIHWEWSDLYEIYKGKLGSATAQQIERKNCEAWRSFFALLRLKRKDKLPPHIQRVSPPGYWKDRQTNLRKRIILLRCDSYRFKQRVLRIPKKLSIEWKGQPKWTQWIKQGRLTIHYDKVKSKWYARQPVEVTPPYQPLSNRRAYIDLGVINLLTVAIDGVRQTLAYSGRPALSDWWYLTHRINHFKSLAKTTNHRDSTYRVRQLFHRRHKRMRHYFNTIVRRAIKDLWKRGVSVLVIGNLTGILANSTGGQKAKSMTHNFWSHRHLVTRIIEVTEEYGMSVELVDERGTSSKCPRCDTHRIIRNGRLFKCCNCRLEAHRDTVGAVNIGVVLGGRINGVMAHPMEVSA